jgi:TolB-like protein
LAVLPLKNLSGDPSQDYVSDGLAEAIISQLAKIAPLRVISRTSIMHFSDTQKPLPEVDTELSVGAVVEGSIARSGDLVRVTIQLLHGPKDHHLSVETYEADYSEIPKISGEIAAAIARAIQVRIQPELRARLTGGAVKREAFDAYLRGRYHWNKRTTEDIFKAVEFFRRAIEEDPTYARAYAGLADCYNQLGTVMIGGRPPTESRPLAIAAAQKRSRSIRSWEKPMPRSLTHDSTIGNGTRRRDFSALSGSTRATPRRTCGTPTTCRCGSATEKHCAK